jgi:hypothetical protein
VVAAMGVGGRRREGSSNMVGCACGLRVTRCTPPPQPHHHPLTYLKLRRTRLVLQTVATWRALNELPLLYGTEVLSEIKVDVVAVFKRFHDCWSCLVLVCVCVCARARVTACVRACVCVRDCVRTVNDRVTAAQRTSRYKWAVAR